MIRKNLLISLLVLAGFTLSCKDKEDTTTRITSVPIEFTKEAEAYLITPSGDTIHRLDIEIAESDYERETGLMYRRSMEEDQGMLFIFDNEEPRGFYMKNTYIPLDLIFLDSNRRVVSIYPNAQPESMETIRSEQPAQYVLEINAGLAEHWDLQPGDSLILTRQ